MCLSLDSRHLLCIMYYGSVSHGYPSRVIPWYLFLCWFKASKSKLQSIFLPNICLKQKFPSFRTHLLFSGWGLGLRGVLVPRLRWRSYSTVLRVLQPAVLGVAFWMLISSLGPMVLPRWVEGRRMNKIFPAWISRRFFFFNKRRKEDFLRFLEM